MTDPILTTIRVSDRPVRWQTRFAAYGSSPEGQYSVELIGEGRTPELARASAAENLDRVKARLLVASITFRCVPEAVEGAEG